MFLEEFAYTFHRSVLVSILATSLKYKKIKNTYEHHEIFFALHVLILSVDTEEAFHAAQALLWADLSVSL